jgi:hypothetical protein
MASSGNFSTVITSSLGSRKDCSSTSRRSSHPLEVEPCICRHFPAKVLFLCTVEKHVGSERLAIQGPDGTPPRLDHLSRLEPTTPLFVMAHMEGLTITSPDCCMSDALSTHEDRRDAGAPPHRKIIHVDMDAF